MIIFIFLNSAIKTKQTTFLQLLFLSLLLFFTASVCSFFRFFFFCSLYDENFPPLFLPITFPQSLTSNDFHIQLTGNFNVSSVLFINLILSFYYFIYNSLDPPKFIFFSIFPVFILLVVEFCSMDQITKIPILILVLHLHFQQDTTQK